MPAKILKADSFVVSPSKSLLSVKGDNPKAALRTEAVGDQEPQVAIAEVKLMVYKLLNDAKRQAEEIIDQAKEQAKQILEQAAAESAGIESARETGYQSGRADEQTALLDDRQKLSEERVACTEEHQARKTRMIREVRACNNRTVSTDSQEDHPCRAEAGAGTDCQHSRGGA